MLDRNTRNLPREAWTNISNIYNKTERTIKDVWNQYQQEKRDETSDDIMLKPKRKCLECTEEVANLMEQSLLEHDGDVTYQEIQQDLESAGFPKSLSTVFKYCKMINVVGKSLYIKPSLTEKHRMLRLKFILNQIDVSNPKFKSVSISRSSQQYSRG